MQRLHAHVTVKDLAAARRFYAALFAAEPLVERPDYLKWQLDEPALNFAVSLTEGAPGISHLGIEAESGGELATLRERMSAAQIRLDPETQANCCYAVSDKEWAADPAGLAWELFHTTQPAA